MILMIVWIAALIIGVSIGTGGIWPVLYRIEMWLKYKFGKIGK
jgi:hypothetical protein